MKDYESMAAALYDGGWRSEDLLELMEEHEMTAEDAERICEEIKKIENKEG